MHPVYNNPGQIWIPFPALLPQCPLQRQLPLIPIIRPVIINYNLNGNTTLAPSTEFRSQSSRRPNNRTSYQKKFDPVNVTSRYKYKQKNNRKNGSVRTFQKDGHQFQEISLAAGHWGFDIKHKTGMHYNFETANIIVGGFADNMGIKAKWKIYTINGVPTKNYSTQQFQDIINGDVSGTIVVKPPAPPDAFTKKFNLNLQNKIIDCFYKTLGTENPDLEFINALDDIHGWQEYHRKQMWIYLKYGIHQYENDKSETEDIEMATSPMNHLFVDLPNRYAKYKPAFLNFGVTDYETMRLINSAMLIELGVVSPLEQTVLLQRIERITSSHGAPKNTKKDASDVGTGAALEIEEKNNVEENGKKEKGNDSHEIDSCAKDGGANGGGKNGSGEAKSCENSWGSERTDSEKREGDDEVVEEINFLEIDEKNEPEENLTGKPTSADSFWVPKNEKRPRIPVGYYNENLLAKIKTMESEENTLIDENLNPSNTRYPFSVGTTSLRTSILKNKEAYAEKYGYKKFEDLLNVYGVEIIKHYNMPSKHDLKSKICCELVCAIEPGDQKFNLFQNSEYTGQCNGYVWRIIIPRKKSFFLDVTLNKHQIVQKLSPFIGLEKEDVRGHIMKHTKNRRYKVLVFVLDGTEIWKPKEKAEMYNKSDEEVKYPFTDFITQFSFRYFNPELE